MVEDVIEDSNDYGESAETQTVSDKTEDYKSKYLYLVAEVENYKKAKDREISDYIRNSNEKFMLNMLKVLDDFESVLKIKKDDDLNALFRSLNSLLSSYGLERMNVVGEEYSPDIAEAILTGKSEDGPGKIIEEIQSGYKLNGKVLRYPKVKVSI